MKNITTRKDFVKNREHQYSINEYVIPMEDHYLVNSEISVPKSLLNAFVKKIKDETGIDMRNQITDMGLAEKIVKYLSDNYLSIENLPVKILVPDNQASQAMLKAGSGMVQGQQEETQQQPDLQGQGQAQQLESDLQGQGQQGQGQQGQGQQGQGQQGQSQLQGQLQGQGQGQGQQLQTPAQQGQGQQLQTPSQQGQKQVQEI